MKKLQAAITLLEIMLATTILVMAFFPVMHLLGVTTKGTLKDFHQINAMNLAESKLNQALQVEYMAANTGTFPSTAQMQAQTVTWPNNNAVVTLGVEPTLINNCQYFTQLRVEEIPQVTFRYRQLHIDVNTNLNLPTSWTWEGVPGDPGTLRAVTVVNKLKKLTLTVAWTEARGENNAVAARINKSYVLHTLKAKLNE